MTAARSGGRGSAHDRRMAAIRAQANDGRGQHLDWLNLVQVSGPFLTLPILTRVWRTLDAFPQPQRRRLRLEYDQWRADTVAHRDQWIEYLLRDLLEWDDALVLRAPSPSGHPAPDTPRETDAEPSDDGAGTFLDRLSLPLPGHTQGSGHDTLLRPDFALVEPGTDPAAAPDAAAAAKCVRLLGVRLPAGTLPTARTGQTGGPATPADHLAKLLRQHAIPLGLVTDGRWWCLVWAPAGGVTTTALFDTVGWNEAAERNVVRAWISLLRRSRFFGVLDKETLVPLLEESEQNQEEVTDALGVQVRQAVELLVEAIGRADSVAVGKGRTGLHAQNVTAPEVYRGAVTVMMRVVFLLFAEERGLLPADNEVYARAYSAGRLCAELEQRVQAEGTESALAYTTSGWHRLVALFRAVHGGVDHGVLRLPAYDGSLFDPSRFWWLEGQTPPGESGDGSPPPLLPIDDRTVLHMLRSVQHVTVRGERRTLSFRALDVEQIGYVYEGLLSYDGKRATSTVLGLIGKPGLEREVELAELERLAAPHGIGASARGGSRPDPKGLAKALCAAYKEPKPGIGSPARLEKLLAPGTAGEQAERERQLQSVTGNDHSLLERLKPFYGLIRKDLRGLPTVIASGSLYVTESTLRKTSGTHYTPRALAVKVVEGALAPLVYEPGPLQTADEDAWVIRRPEHILQLKVADIAMGSAAFLVGACRYLADRLIEARAREEDADPDAAAYRARLATGESARSARAVDAEADPVVVRARREIIEHCLYGVDINPLAVEMAKLSLWLVSMDTERPFTFLDDRLVAGDSLLGIDRVAQLETVHLDPAEGRRWNENLDQWTEGARSRVRQVAGERREIADISGDDLPSVDKKRRKLIIVHRHTARLGLIADLAAGAGLATAGRSEEARREVYETAARMAGGIADEEVQDTDPVVQTARERALSWLRKDTPQDGLVREPVHWPLEFPEVFEPQPGRDRSGFDAVIGNPPFLGGQKLTGAMGEAYREYLVQALGRRRRGSADLVAYFVLRAHQLLNGEGQTGLVATNTLAQGDTREVGLEQLLGDGVEIRQAVKSAPWPSRSAVLEYCAVWTSVPGVGEHAERRLGETVVPTGISAALNPRSRVSDWAERLVENAEVSFQGSNVLGLGFTLPEEQAREWIAEDERYAEVLFPYLNGQDVNTSPVHGTDRWVINFRDWPEEKAKRYPKAYAKVLREVKPERDANNRKVYRDYWWHYGEKRPAMLTALTGLERCIVIALVSKAVMPVTLSTGRVFSHMLGVFASDDYGLLALLSSAPHYWWAIDRASTMKGDLRYTPSDVFETLVRPDITDRLRDAGFQADSHRRDLMSEREIGLTATYNLVHDESCTDADIRQLRSLHREIDLAVAEAYGWSDLLEFDNGLDHGFHETDQGLRYTIGPVVRTEILDRLRELNHQRYADEVYLKLHKKDKQYPDRPQPSAEALRRKRRGRGATDFTDDALFAPDDTIF